jgi:predicted RNA polymerase sigma factor
VRACVQRDRPGPYQIQAAINAVHSVAPSFDRTDLLRRLGRGEGAAAAYATARSLTANPVEQAFPDTQRATLSPSHPAQE